MTDSAYPEPEFWRLVDDSFNDLLGDSDLAVLEQQLDGNVELQRRTCGCAACTPTCGWLSEAAAGHQSNAADPRSRSAAVARGRCTAAAATVRRSLAVGAADRQQHLEQPPGLGWRVGDRGVVLRRVRPAGVVDEQAAAARGGPGAGR